MSRFDVRLASLTWWRWRALPALDLKAPEPGEIGFVRGDKYQFVDTRNRCDLSIDEGRRTTRPHESCPLQRMPIGGPLVVVEDRKADRHHVVEIALDRLAPPRLGESGTAETKFVPYESRDRHFAVMVAEPTHDRSGGLRPQWFRHHVGVE